jgi:hypothetical protein
VTLRLEAQCLTQLRFRVPLFSDQGGRILIVSGGNAYVVSLNMIINGTESRQLSTLWTYAAGRSGKVRRFGLFLKEEKWQVTSGTNMFPLEFRASAKFKRCSLLNISICTESVFLILAYARKLFLRQMAQKPYSTGN